MDILVKNWDLPYGCMGCPFFTGNGCKVTMSLFPDWMNAAARPTGCPLGVNVNNEGNGTMNEDENVYVVFGDEPRNDGSNIYGIFKSLSSAQEEVRLAEKRKPFVEYHIEVHGLWE